jgi:ATP synthase F1 delta subunit
MSFTKKIVTTYSKSLFQNVSNLQKSKKNSNFGLEEIRKFEISKIASFTEKQNEDFVTVYAIGEELILIRSFLVSSNKIKNLFNNPTLPEQQKLDLLLSVFPGLSLITRSFLKVLTEKTHLGLIPEISNEYNEILSKFNSSTHVKLITASVLQESYGLLLLKTLKKITNSKEIILNISYNPQLLGGLIIEYNSTSTDASILKEFSLFFNEI